MTGTSLHLLNMSNIVQPRGIFEILQGRLNIASKGEKNLHVGGLTWDIISNAFTVMVKLLLRSSSWTPH